MASSRLNKKGSQVYDPIRNLWVAALPEELVRQKLLHNLLRLGFLKGHIAVEKELKELPHISMHTHLPDRRIDILCFAPNLHPEYSLYPLLLIECKEKFLHNEALEQVFGYNEYVKAPFCAIASAQEIQVGYKVNQEIKFLPFLPSYQELIDAVH